MNLGWFLVHNKGSQVRIFNYGICPKILNTFLFLLSNKMLIIMAGIIKMLVWKENREGPDQTASSEGV